MVRGRPLPRFSCILGAFFVFLLIFWGICILYLDSSTIFPQKSLDSGMFFRNNRKCK
jgi:hypothetical protein